MSGIVRSLFNFGRWRLRDKILGGLLFGSQTLLELVVVEGQDEPTEVAMASDLAEALASAAERRLGFRKDAVTRLLVFPRGGADGAAAARAALEVLGPAGAFRPRRRGRRPSVIDTAELLGIVDLFYAGFVVFIGIAGTFSLAVAGVGVANYELALLAERSVEVAVARGRPGRGGVHLVLPVG